MSTTEERLDALEEQGGKVKRPDDCIYCHIRSSGFRHSPFHKITDAAVREFLIDEKQADCCDHRVIGPFSVQFSNFIASALLQYVMENHLELQNDYDFIYNTFQDKKIMIPAIEKEAKRYANGLREGTLAYARKKDEIEYWKAKIDNIPIYASWAKEMYEK